MSLGFPSYLSSTVSSLVKEHPEGFLSLSSVGLIMKKEGGEEQDDFSFVSVSLGATTSFWTCLVKSVKFSFARLAGKKKYFQVAPTFFLRLI